MGKKDIIQKLYTEDNRIFADIVNFMLYDGREVICPDDLQELSCEQAILTERENFNAKKDKTGKHRSPKYIGIQRYRDVQKKLVIRQAKDAVYVLICLENQSEVHYAMPIRNMLNDALNYARQVEALSRQHLSETNTLSADSLETGISKTDVSATDVHKRHRKEFLSGIYKEDKLLPVISFVLLFQNEEWDGPASVYEMLCTDDPAILRYVQDYKLNLIVPAELTEEALRKFHSSLREVLSFIKYSKNKEQMSRLIEENSTRFCRMEREAVAVINLFTGTNIEIREEEEVIDMCKAWEDMGEEKRAEGLEAARAENRKKQKRIVQNMIDRGYLPEDIMAIMECSREELQQFIV